jgi:hypothetical protein
MGATYLRRRRWNQPVYKAKGILALSTTTMKEKVSRKYQLVVHLSNIFTVLQWH